jgi:phospholipid-transporting ATPase
MVSGVFEKDLPEDILLNHPELYPTFKKDALFNYMTLITWISRALWHSIILFFGPLLASYWMNEGVLGVGLQDDLWTYGTITMTGAIFTIMIRHSLEFKVSMLYK